jgi:hypothetical protein
VVASEWVEGSELVPAETKFLSGVTNESTNIGASERDSKETKGEDSRD